MGGMLIFLVLSHYIALASNMADLGFFLTNLRNVGTEYARAFFWHTQPLMIVWGWGYRELPADVAPGVLLVMQAVILLSSVAAIWRVFGTWSGIAMLLYYPFWVNALFDFHFDHLAIPLLSIFFIACEKQYFAWAAVSATALIIVKEPFALQTVACGAYFWWLAYSLRGQGYSIRLLLLGLYLVAVGGGMFYVLTNWLIPYFADDTSHFGLTSEAFAWLGKGLINIVWMIVSRPDLILAEVIGTPGKLIYLSVIFGLLAFVPLLRPAALIVALPILMISMFSRLENYYDYANHYTAGVIMPTIVAFRNGLPIAYKYFSAVLEWMQRVRCWWYLKRALVRKDLIFSWFLGFWLLIGHWAFASSPISRLFWSDKVWSYSWRSYWPTERTAMMKEAMLKYIPVGPEVSVSTQNTVDWYHLADRKMYWLFPMGIAEPQKVMDWSNRSLKGLWWFIRTGYRSPTITHNRFADYVVLDLKRPYFVLDRGCEWIYGECRDKGMERKFLGWLSYTRDHYDTVFEKDGFMILKRQSLAAD